MSIKDIREIALSNVFLENPDYDYFYRKVCRWYSKNFHTPLPQVQALPAHDVFQNFFEGYFEEMDEGDLELEVQRLLNPEMDDEEDIQDFIDMIEELEEKKGRIKPKPKNDAERQSSRKEKGKTDSKPVQVSRSFDEESPPPEAGQGLEDLGQLGQDDRGDQS